MSASGEVDGAENDSEFEEKQKDRALMREKFLRVMTAISGQRCEFVMHQRTQVKGELRGCDRDVQHLAISNLETPLGVLPQSILRTSDVLNIHIPTLPISPTPR